MYNVVYLYSRHIYKGLAKYDTEFKFLKESLILIFLFNRGKRRFAAT